MGPNDQNMPCSITGTSNIPTATHHQSLEIEPEVDYFDQMYPILTKDLPLQWKCTNFSRWDDVTTTCVWPWTQILQHRKCSLPFSLMIWICGDCFFFAKSGTYLVHFDVVTQRPLAVDEVVLQIVRYLEPNHFLLQTWVHHWSTPTSHTLSTY